MFISNSSILLWSHCRSQPVRPLGLTTLPRSICSEQSLRQNRWFCETCFNNRVFTRDGANDQVCPKLQKVIQIPINWCESTGSLLYRFRKFHGGWKCWRKGGWAPLISNWLRPTCFCLPGSTTAFDKERIPWLGKLLEKMCGCTSKVLRRFLNIPYLEHQIISWY